MKGEVTGIEKANEALNAELRKVGKLSERFVTKSLISISANTAPMVPIDTSFLLSSEYRKVEKLFDGFVGEIGFGAEYAKWVHEMPGTLKGQPRANFGKTREGVEFGGGTGKGNYWDPDAEPQFLAKGVEAFIADDLDALLRQELGE